MTNAFYNGEGVLVVDAGPVALESATGLGPAAWRHVGATVDGGAPVYMRQINDEGEVATDDVRDCAGE